MKLNWFSPLLPAKTDIARYTSELLPDVCALADVTLWTTQAKWDPCLPEQVPIQRYRVDRIPWLEINAADMSIFQMGNNPEFHGDIWQVARRQPGIVVLHDTSLHHFFEGIYRRKLRDLDRHVEVMRRYYGREGAEAALRNAWQAKCTATRDDEHAVSIVRLGPCSPNRYDRRPVTTLCAIPEVKCELRSVESPLLSCRYA